MRRIPMISLAIGLAAGACDKPPPPKKLELKKETVQRLDAGPEAPPTPPTNQPLDPPPRRTPPTNQAPDPPVTATPR